MEGDELNEREKELKKELNDEGHGFSADLILRKKTLKAKDILKECLNLNEIDMSIGINAMFSLSLIACIKQGTKKSVMMNTLSYFWDDLEEQINNTKKL